MALMPERVYHFYVLDVQSSIGRATARGEESVGGGGRVTEAKLGKGGVSENGRIIIIFTMNICVVIVAPESHHSIAAK